jgi:hypothetical protein
MSVANPLWGSATDYGELLKLGIDVGQTTVAKYMARKRRPPSQGWKTFLRDHADCIASIDLFVVLTISLRLLYALLVLRHSRPELLWLVVTASPTRPSAESSRSAESTSVLSGGSPSQPGQISLSKRKSLRLVLPGSTTSFAREGLSVGSRLRSRRSRSAPGADRLGGNSWPRGHEAARLPASTGPGHRTEGTFRNSLVENLRELARLPPAFNLTGDPILANISERASMPNFAPTMPTICAAEEAARQRQSALISLVHRAE